MGRKDSWKKEDDWRREEKFLHEANDATEKGKAAQRAEYEDEGARLGQEKKEAEKRATETDREGSIQLLEHILSTGKVYEAADDSGLMVKIMFDEGAAEVVGSLQSPEIKDAEDFLNAKPEEIQYRTLLDRLFGLDIAYKQNLKKKEVFFLARELVVACRAMEIDEGKFPASLEDLAATMRAPSLANSMDPKRILPDRFRLFERQGDGIVAKEVQVASDGLHDVWQVMLGEELARTISRKFKEKTLDGREVLEEGVRAQHSMEGSKQIDVYMPIPFFLERAAELGLEPWGVMELNEEDYGRQFEEIQRRLQGGQEQGEQERQ